MIESGVELLGFRMPAYEGTDRPMKRRTWEWLIDALKTLRDRPAIIIGDFNTAFGDSVSRCGDCLDALTESGWRPAVPADGFSWRGRTNGTERRIDLAFLSPSATARSVSYSWSFRDIGEEASAMQIGRPDHAMLLLEAETTTA
jgi:endonuclease/exonuclease/phosphatase family metal-dependent hydrolase